MSIVYSIARSFGTGREPGIPKHTGQVRVFGSPPNATSHPQNIFEFVDSSTCISRPIVVS